MKSIGKMKLMEVKIGAFSKLGSRGKFLNSDVTQTDTQV